jgi:hypothetical protein
VITDYGATDKAPLHMFFKAIQRLSNFPVGLPVGHEHGSVPSYLKFTPDFYLRPRRH